MAPSLSDGIIIIIIHGHHQPCTPPLPLAIMTEFYRHISYLSFWFFFFFSVCFLFGSLLACIRERHTHTRHQVLMFNNCFDPWSKKDLTLVLVVWLVVSMQCTRCSLNLDEFHFTFHLLHFRFIATSSKIQMNNNSCHIFPLGDILSRCLFTPFVVKMGFCFQFAFLRCEFQVFSDLIFL